MGTPSSPDRRKREVERQITQAIHALYGTRSTTVKVADFMSTYESSHQSVQPAVSTEASNEPPIVQQSPLIEAKTKTATTDTDAKVVTDLTTKETFGPSLHSQQDEGSTAEERFSPDDPPIASRPGVWKFTWRASPSTTSHTTQKRSKLSSTAWERVFEQHRLIYDGKVHYVLSVNNMTTMNAIKQRRLDVLEKSAIRERKVDAMKKRKAAAIKKSNMGSSNCRKADAVDDEIKKGMMGESRERSAEALSSHFRRTVDLMREITMHMSSQESIAIDATAPEGQSTQPNKLGSVSPSNTSSLTTAVPLVSVTSGTITTKETKSDIARTAATGNDAQTPNSSPPVATPGAPARDARALVPLLEKAERTEPASQQQDEGVNGEGIETVETDEQEEKDGGFASLLHAVFDEEDAKASKLNDGTSAPIDNESTVSTIGKDPDLDVTSTKFTSSAWDISELRSVLANGPMSQQPKPAVKNLPPHNYRNTTDSTPAASVDEIFCPTIKRVMLNRHGDFYPIFDRLSLLTQGVTVTGAPASLPLPHKVSARGVKRGFEQLAMKAEDDRRWLGIEKSVSILDCPSNEKEYVRQAFKRELGVPTSLDKDGKLPNLDFVMVVLERLTLRSKALCAARKKVWETTELLENILSFLPPGKILTVQSVSKTFRDCYQGSKNILQIKTFQQVKSEVTTMPAMMLLPRPLVSHGWIYNSLLQNGPPQVVPMLANPNVMTLQAVLKSVIGVEQVRIGHYHSGKVHVFVRFEKKADLRFKHTGSWQELHLTDPAMPFTLSLENNSEKLTIVDGVEEKLQRIVDTWVDLKVCKLGRAMRLAMKLERYLRKHMAWRGPNGVLEFRGDVELKARMPEFSDLMKSKFRYKVKTTVVTKRLN